MIAPLDPAALRKELGLSLADLAARLGLSKSTIYGWETRRRAPSIADGHKLAVGLGLSKDDTARLLAWWGGGK